MAYIIGPNMLIIMKANNGNIIYLIGEVHTILNNVCEDQCLNTKCYDIYDVLVSIFEKNCNTQISFDIEVFKLQHYRQKAKFPKTSLLYNIFFDEFFNINKKYKNVFFYREDFRIINGYSLFLFKDENFSDILKNTKFKIENKKFFEIFYHNDIFLKIIKIYMLSDNFIEEIEQLLSRYDNFFIKKYLAINMKNLNDFYRIDINGKTYSITGFLLFKLKTINNKRYEIIYNFIITKINHINDEFLKDLNEQLKSDENISWASFYKYFFFMTTNVLDIHVLSNFYINIYDYFKYNIFYYGTIHILNYYKLFKIFGYKLLGFYKGNITKDIYDNNCIKITNIEDILNPEDKT